MYHYDASRCELSILSYGSIRIVNGLKEPYIKKIEPSNAETSTLVENNYKKSINNQTETEKQI